MNYILEGKIAVPCDDLMKWARWFEDIKRRRVAHDRVKHVTISTVFLGIDHSFGGKRPLLFETMIFGGKHDEYQDRCETWKQAEKMHAKALALVKKRMRHERNL